MSAYRKVNGQMISVTTEGHPQYYFDTLAQAEAALSQLEEGADVFIKEGSNEDLLPRVEQAEENIVQINNNLSEYLIRRDVSVPSVTLTANQSILHSVTCPSISGYSLFGINGVFCQNGNVKVSGAYLSIDSNEINIGLYNTTSSSQTASQFVCVVDYVKTLS